MRCAVRYRLLRAGSWCALLLLCASTGCRPPPRLVPNERSLPWPTAASWERLFLPPEAQAWSLPVPAGGERVLEHAYPGRGPTHHGRIATLVRFYVQRNVFYVQSDCQMGHHDPWLGPFEGDPRMVLQPEGGDMFRPPTTSPR